MDNRERTNKVRSAPSGRAASGKPGLVRAFASGAHSRPILAAWLISALTLAIGSTNASAQLIPTEKPEQIQEVDVEEKLGLPVATRLTLTDSSGETLPLAEIFDGDKPVVVAPVYFGCPVVCPLVLDRLTNSFRELDYSIGEDFEILVFSIDAGEGPTESNAAKMRYTGSYAAGADRDLVAVREGWYFATGDETTVRELADSMGWIYQPLPNGEFSHPTAIMVASPDGVLTRYIYGFDFPAKQMKLRLLDASEGKIAQSLGDKLLHYCYRFDPQAGAYTMEAMAVMRIAGVLTVLGLIVLIGGLFAWESSKKKRDADASPERASTDRKHDTTGTDTTEGRPVVISA